MVQGEEIAVSSDEREGEGSSRVGVIAAGGNQMHHTIGDSLKMFL